MRQRLIGRLCVVSAFVLLSSCGGGKSPTTPTVTVTSITVTSSSGFLMVGQSETFTATLNMSNGTTQALSTGGTWGTDAPTVATVVATTGAVTSIRSGDVTIFVDAQGVRGTKRITIMPNYAGIWGGTYVVNNCTQTGQWPAVINGCGTVFTIGATLPVAFNLTQNGGTITGQTAIGTNISGQFSTTAIANGALSFNATYLSGTFSLAQAWQLNQAVAGQLTGSAVQTWTDSQLPGQMVVTTTLVSVTKASAMPLVMRLGAPRESSLDSVTEALRRVSR